MGEWKNYFVYTKRERWAVLALLTIILALAAIPHVFEPPLVPATGGFAGRVVEIPRLDSQDAHPAVSGPEWSASRRDGSFKARKLFPFDPNTASVDEFQKLGISGKAATVILHYREKGGRFRRPEDLAKVYSIPKRLYTDLLPYVRIASQGLPAPEPAQQQLEARTPRPFSRQSIDVNLASQDDWEKLPGIGPTLAKRIITFRDRLGGFISVEQVKETYGLADSVFQRIHGRLGCENPKVKTIDINLATVDEMKVHPYLRGRMAYSISRYREQHGRFGSLDDVNKLQGMTDSVREKVIPYLVVKFP